MWIRDSVAGVLCQPVSGRMCGHPDDPHPTSGVLDGEERVEPSQRDRLEVEQSQATMPAACAFRNCCQVGPDRRGAGSGPCPFMIDQTVEAPIPVPETGEFAVDPPPVAPAGLSTTNRWTRARKPPGIDGRPG